MRIAEDEIGQLNLLEYDALMKRKEMDDDRQRLDAGIVAAAIVNNLGGGVNGKAVSALDYVPRLKAAVGEADDPYDLTKMSPDQQQRYFMALFSRHMKKKGADA